MLVFDILIGTSEDVMFNNVTNVILKKIILFKKN